MERGQKQGGEMSGGKSGCGICKIIKLVAGIGALNWGLVGIWQVDLVAKFLGPMSTASRTVYALIGLAGLMTLVSLAKCCPCQKGACEPKG